MKTYVAVLGVLSVLIAHSAWAAPTVTVTVTAGTNATSHRVEKQTNGGTFSALTTLTMPTVAYTDTAVALSSTYCYRAVSITAIGESPASTPCCAALFTPGVPSLSCVVNP